MNDNSRPKAAIVASHANVTASGIDAPCPESRATFLPARLIDAMAADLGRLQRHTDPNSSSHHAIGRLSDQLESIDAASQPTAHELYREYFCICGDHDVALDEALRATDRRARALRKLLGREADDELADILEVAQRRERERSPLRAAA